MKYYVIALLFVRAWTNNAIISPRFALISCCLCWEPHRSWNKISLSKYFLWRFQSSYCCSVLLVRLVEFVDIQITAMNCRRALRSLVNRLIPACVRARRKVKKAKERKPDISVPSAAYDEKRITQFHEPATCLPCEGDYVIVMSFF